MTDDKTPIDKKDMKAQETLETSPQEQKSVSTASEPLDDNQREKKADQASDLFAAKPIPKMPTKKSSRQWLGKGLLALLLFLALMISAWVAYQQWLFQKDWIAMQASVEEQLTKQKDQMVANQSLAEKSLQAINQTQIQLNQLSNKVQQSEQMLLSTQERIKSLSGRQKQDWMLAEVAYLIKLAQLQLSLQKDKTTAMQLLKTADSRLIEISDNSLLPVREAIAQDLSELSLIMQSDVTGIAMSLSAISETINHLSLAAIQIQETSVEAETTQPEPTEEGFNLEQIYQKFLQDFVVIKDYSEPVKPLITPDMRRNLEANIQLALQQARIALIQSNEVLYRKNIDNAIKWIKEFYIKDDKRQQVIQRLNQLKTMPVDIRYPNQLNAQIALKQVSQQQLYRWLESSLGGGAVIQSKPIEQPIESRVKTDKTEETSASSNEPVDSSAKQTNPESAPDPEVKP